MNPDAQNPNPNDTQPGGVTTPQAATTPPAPDAAPTPPVTPEVPAVPTEPAAPTPPAAPTEVPTQVAPPDATGKKPANKMLMVAGAVVLVFVVLIAVLMVL